jgi:hypothetical protein
MKKTQKDLEVELQIIDKLKEERKQSDDLYAIKLVEKIVFALVSLLLISIIGALIKLVIVK